MLSLVSFPHDCVQPDTHRLLASWHRQPAVNNNKKKSWFQKWWKDNFMCRCLLQRKTPRQLADRENSFALSSTCCHAGLTETKGQLKMLNCSVRWCCWTLFAFRMRNMLNLNYVFYLWICAFLTSVVSIVKLRSRANQNIDFGTDIYTTCFVFCPLTLSLCKSSALFVMNKVCIILTSSTVTVEPLLTRNTDTEQEEKEQKLWNKEVTLTRYSYI